MKRPSREPLWDSGGGLFPAHSAAALRSPLRRASRGPAGFLALTGPLRSECNLVDEPGRLAQLGERLPYKQEVGGSIPSPPITSQTLRGRTARWRGRRKGRPLHLSPVRVSRR